jgi:hypothetical protein
VDNIFPVVFPIIMVAIGTVAVTNSILRRRKFANKTVVDLGVEYPNNHHVFGVGYYHAAVQRWFPQPWNEYRETRGYYWEGTWHSTPDQRLILKSIPSTDEINRVNQAWRDADPDRARQFWDTVEQQGFGTAIGRSEGS